jgi:hypothetical protein
MTTSPQALPSGDGQHNWRPLQTGAPAGLARGIFFLLVGLICGGSMAFLGHEARDSWFSSLVVGSGAFIVMSVLWTTLWTFQHGSFNFDINQKTKRIRKWKTSLFLKRSFDEYGFDDFCAVRSMQKFDGDVYCVVVELLFKAKKPALEVARFNAVGRIASYLWRGSNTLCLLTTESPSGVALRQELVKLIEITDAGYFDKEQ